MGAVDNPDKDSPERASNDGSGDVFLGSLFVAVLVAAWITSGFDLAARLAGFAAMSFVISRTATRIWVPLAVAAFAALWIAFGFFAAAFVVLIPVVLTGLDLPERLDFAWLALGIAVAFAIWPPSDLATVRIAAIAVAAAVAAVKLTRAFGWRPAS